MKSWFKNIGYKFQSWMQGRYGLDELNTALAVVSLVLLLLSHIPGLMHLYILSLAALIWSMVRCYSKKLDKRRSERAAYLRFTGRIKGWFVLQKRRITDRKAYRYYRCPQCKIIARVPAGKGRIRISCPCCTNSFEKKT